LPPRGGEDEILSEFRYKPGSLLFFVAGARHEILSEFRYKK